MSMRLKLAVTLVVGLAAAVSPTAAFAWGALAINGNHGDAYGFSYSYGSRRAAENKALGECGDNCRIVQVFASGCAAYAADQSPGSSIYGWWNGANSGGEARSGAMGECRSHGGHQCIVRVWGCN
jgi:Domain of unknown function (DUF4189)